MKFVTTSMSKYIPASTLFANSGQLQLSPDNSLKIVEGNSAGPHKITYTWPAGPTLWFTNTGEMGWVHGDKFQIINGSGKCSPLHFACDNDNCATCHHQ